MGKGQFSWTDDGKPDKIDLSTTTLKRAWTDTVYSAIVVYYELEKDPTKGATYYHAPYVNPNWSKDYKKVYKTDGHIFYVDKHSKIYNVKLDEYIKPLEKNINDNVEMVFASYERNPNRDIEYLNLVDYFKRISHKIFK